MISKDLPIVLYFVGEEKLSMANNCPPQKIIAVPETKSKKVGEMFFFSQLRYRYRYTIPIITL
jgi:hypothetical protein